MVPPQENKDGFQQSSAKDGVRCSQLYDQLRAPIPHSPICHEVPPGMDEPLTAGREVEPLHMVGWAI